MRSRTTVFVVAFAVMVAACTESQPTGTSGGDVPAPSESPAESAGSGTENDPAGDASQPDPDVPPLPILTAVDVAEPGATATITADPRLDGEAFLVGPDGDLASAPMEKGTALLAIPAGTAQGGYGLRLGEGDAVGAISVMNRPGLAVAGTGYVRPGDAAEVDVIIHGLEAGTVAALETRSDDGTIERLTLHPMLGLAPLPATATAAGLPEGRHHLVLPNGFTGTVRVIAGPPDLMADPYGEETATTASTDLRIQTCDALSGVIGHLGAGGVVSVRRAGSASPARTRTGDGVFRLETGPGWILVSAIRDDGTKPAASPQVVKVGCGGLVDVGDLETRLDTGPEAGEYLGGLTVDELWAYHTIASGDLTFEQEGFADCSAEGGVLEVTLGASSADPWLYTLTLDPPLDTGAYEATLHLEDIFTGDTADGSLSGEIEVGRIDDLDAIGGAFSGTIDGTLGTSDIEIRFTCAVFSLTGMGPAPGGALLPGGKYAAVHHIPNLKAQIGGGISSGEECKKLFINGSQSEAAEGLVEVVMDHWAAMLMPEVPRVSIITANDIRTLLDLEAMQQLFGVGDGEIVIEIGGALGSDFLLHLDNKPAGESWFFTAALYDVSENRRLAGIEASGATAETAAEAALDRWPELVEPLARAGICAEFEPQTAVVDVGATEDFTLEVTDLAGEPPEAGEVLEFSSSCGTWEPSSGAVDGDTWSTTFTAGDEACEERVFVTVEADGTVGTVEDRADVGVRVEALWRFAATITFEDEHSRITAESSGEFFVESDFDALIGAGTGRVDGTGEAYCEVNDVVTWQPFTLVGDYRVMVAGEVTARPEDAPWDVKFAPMGFGIQTQMTYQTSSDCIEAGTYGNDLLGFLGVGALVGMPHWMNNQPDGFATYLNPSGESVTFEETLIGLPGASITVTLSRPQP